MTPVELNHESYMKYLLNYEYRERGGETGETEDFIYRRIILPRALILRPAAVFFVQETSGLT